MVVGFGGALYWSTLVFDYRGGLRWWTPVFDYRGGFLLSFRSAPPSFRSPSAPLSFFHCVRSVVVPSDKKLWPQDMRGAVARQNGAVRRATALIQSFEVACFS